MLRNTRFELLFDGTLKNSAPRRLKYLNFVFGVTLVVQILTVVFAVFVSCIDSISLNWYYLPLTLLTATNIQYIILFSEVKKLALRQYEFKKAQKTPFYAYGSFANLCDRCCQICKIGFIVVLFLTCIVVGVIVFGYYTIGADIISFLRVFTSVIVLVVIIVQNVYNMRCVSLDKEFSERSAEELDKIYYLQCKDTPMPTLVTKKPGRFLLFVACVLYGIPSLKMRFHCKIDKTALKKLKPPYMVINNHGSPADFRVASPSLYPVLSNFIVAYSQFVGRTWVFQNMGIIPKRQFDNSLGAIREAQRVFKRNGVLTFYPEGKVSSDGRSGIIRPAMAKFVKLCGVPVVFMHTQGIYIARPKWANKIRKFDVRVDFDVMLSAEDLKNKSIEQIDQIMQSHFGKVDDFEYQSRNNIALKSDKRAEGLHNILYVCPHCGVAYKTNSKGNYLFCENCGKKWYLTPLNQLQATEGETEYKKITDWYDWERDLVNQEIETGKYAFSSRCELQYLADFESWHTLGKGSILQSDGCFRYIGDDAMIMEFDTTAIFSLPYDFDWGIYLNDDRFSYRVLLSNKAAGTKINFAVEKFFDMKHNK